MDFGTGFYLANGFRLIMDDGAVKSPTKAPNENLDHGTSLDREVTFVIPESTRKATLRVGYYPGQQSDIAIPLAGSP